MRFLPSRIGKWIAYFIQEQRGVSAIEFALIAPVMIAMLLGSIEINLLLTADRKVTQTASAIADLVAQDDVITDDEIDDIFLAASTILTPYSVDPLQMRITSIKMDADGEVTVVWSEGHGIGGRAPGSTISTPSGILQPDTSIIMSEVSYDYDSVVGSFLNTSISLEDTFYLRPRRSAEVIGP